MPGSFNDRRDKLFFFYSLDMLPGIWQRITLLNPVVYLISGFRWSFYGVADVNIGQLVDVEAALAGLVLAEPLQIGRGLRLARHQAAVDHQGRTAR